MSFRQYLLSRSMNFFSGTEAAIENETRGLIERSRNNRGSRLMDIVRSGRPVSYNLVYSFYNVLRNQDRFIRT